MSNDPGDEIQRSWHANAAAWIKAIREKTIESRRLVTDSAILEAIMRRAPKRVLDVGCGEGWLCRALAAQNVKTVGIDASVPLVEAAIETGEGEYHCLTYHELASAEALGQFDVLVCNFSLLERDLGPILAGLKARLSSEGALIIQTVHPETACRDTTYQDGWRTERFDAMGAAFSELMPWYFRTRESWLDVLTDAGWQAVRLQEPAHPETGIPLSLLIEALL